MGRIPKVMNRPIVGPKKLQLALCSSTWRVTKGPTPPNTMVGTSRLCKKIVTSSRYPADGGGCSVPGSGVSEIHIRGALTLGRNWTLCGGAQEKGNSAMPSMPRRGVLGGSFSGHWAGDQSRRRWGRNAPGPPRLPYTMTSDHSSLFHFTAKTS